LRPKSPDSSSRENYRFVYDGFYSKRRRRWWWFSWW